MEIRYLDNGGSALQGVNYICKTHIRKARKKLVKVKPGRKKPVDSAFWFSQPVNIVPSNVQVFL